MADEELTSLSARDLLARLRAGGLSAVDVAKAHLGRIERLDGRLHAFQHVRGGDLLIEAVALDQRPDRASLPLFGVPIAVTDELAIAGSPLRRGSAATDSVPAKRDHPLVERLRAAGALIVGSTQTSELGIWPFTEPAAFPAPRNPWGEERSPGGAMGGAGAAVASGMATVAIGGDGNGSIRVTASCCGLFGIKPSPARGAAGDRAATSWNGLVAYGPIARSVDDAALVLAVLGGGPVDDRPVLPPSALRIAYDPIHPSPSARMRLEVRQAVRNAAGVFRDAGHTVIAARPPYSPDLPARFARRWLAGISEDAEGLPRKRLERRTRRMARRGRRYVGKPGPISEEAFAEKMRVFFADYDALITPTVTTGAPPIGSSSRSWIRAMMQVGNWMFTNQWNLAGLPAASVPYEHDVDGLPIGIQLVAPRGGEATILALAAQMEAVHPWPQLAPDPDALR